MCANATGRPTYSTRGPAARAAAGGGAGGAALGSWIYDYVYVALGAHCDPHPARDGVRSVETRQEAR